MKEQVYDRLQLGMNIRMRRHVMKITQSELALKAHCSRDTISKLERGKRDISVLMLCNICFALELRIKDMLEGVG